MAKSLAICEECKELYSNLLRSLKTRIFDSSGTLCVLAGPGGVKKVCVWGGCGGGAWHQTRIERESKGWKRDLTS